MGELFILAIFLAFYFLPTIIASQRGHNSTGAIFLLNFLLGWTFMGWIAALIWSFTNPSTVVERDSNSAADEIAKLATLKDLGVLTEKEFNDKKRQILDRV
jgi:RsiW-degrading membrane proteinase PrsW (M82 family)